MQELMHVHGCESIAFELLGPPRLSKLLYEAFLLRQICETMDALLKCDPEQISMDMEKLILRDCERRSAILSIGIPILLSDGKRLLRGPEMKIPAYRGETRFEITPETIDTWAREGWVDLRASNMRIWKQRMALIFEEIASMPADDTSSQYDRDRSFWQENNGEINVGKVVGWIFSNEEHGLRMKD